MFRPKYKAIRRQRGRHSDATTVNYYPESRNYLGNYSKNSIIAQAFTDANSNGHTFVYKMSDDHISGMVEFDGKLYLKELFAAEQSIIERVKTLLTSAKKPASCSPPLGLSDTQKSAFSLAFNAPVSIITGGPGTGKTTVSSAVLSEASRMGLEPVAMAPTGKAAKRMEEALQGLLRPSTIHRGLAWQVSEEDTSDSIGGGPRFNRASPLPSKLLLIDECSMIDLPLMAYLLDAVAEDARIVFVGDADQLPPVGPGQPFLDFIRSEIIPTIVLDRIFRQVEGSSISLACQAINQGNPSKFFAATEASNEIVLLEDKNTVKSISAIASDGMQVLSPKRDSTALLNNVLAPLLNPPRGGGHDNASPYSSLPLAFDLVGRVGDKVQQIKNNYFKEVFNGDQGIIEKVGFMDLSLHRVKRGNKQIIYSTWPTNPNEAESEFAGAIRLSDSYLPYLADESAAEMMLAYAITIHRSQGSEWDNIAIDINNGSYGFFSRRLFFTALSRAKRRAYIAGTPNLIAKAIMTNRDDNRRSVLADRLRNEING